MVDQILLFLILSRMPDEALRDSLNHQPRFEGAWDISGIWEAGKRVPKGTPYLNGTFRISRDGEVWKSSLSERRTQFRRGRLDTHDSGEIYLVNGKTRFVLFTDGGAGLKPGAPVSYETNYQKGFLPPISSDFAPFVTGYAPVTSRPLADIIKDASRRREGNREIYTLRDKHGETTLALDADRDNCVVSLDVSLGPDDINGFGQRLKEVPEAEGGPYEHICYGFQVVSFRKVGDKTFPAEWTFKKSVKAVGDEEAAFSNTIRLKKLELNPVFDAKEFDPSAVIKDGSPVQVENSETVAYEWRNGAPQKSVDASLTGASYQFRPATWKSGPWLWAGLAVLAAVLVFVLWQRKRAAF